MAEFIISILYKKKVIEVERYNMWIIVQSLHSWSKLWTIHVLTFWLVERIDKKINESVSYITMQSIT